MVHNRWVGEVFVWLYIEVPIYMHATWEDSDDGIGIYSVESVPTSQSDK
jgi:hypothetical protein